MVFAPSVALTLLRKRPVKFQAFLRETWRTRSLLLCIQMYLLTHLYLQGHN